MKAKQNKRVKYFKKGQFEIGKPFNPYNKLIGCFIPDGLLEFPKLLPQSKLIWGKLAQHAGKDGRCFPNEDTLSAETGLSLSTVKRAIYELTKKGFIHVDRTRKLTTPKEQKNHYLFLFHKCLEGNGTGTPETPVIENEQGSQNDGTRVTDANNRYATETERGSLRGSRREREDPPSSVDSKEPLHSSGKPDAEKMANADWKKKHGEGKDLARINCPDFQECKDRNIPMRCYDCKLITEIRHRIEHKKLIEREGFCCGKPDEVWNTRTPGEGELFDLVKNVCRVCDKWDRWTVGQVDACEKIKAERIRVEELFKPDPPKAEPVERIVEMKKPSFERIFPCGDGPTGSTGASAESNLSVRDRLIKSFEGMCHIGFEDIESVVDTLIKRGYDDVDKVLDQVWNSKEEYDTEEKLLEEFPDLTDF